MLEIIGIIAAGITVVQGCGWVWSRFSSLIKRRNETSDTVPTDEQDDEDIANIIDTTNSLSAEPVQSDDVTTALVRDYVEKCDSDTEIEFEFNKTGDGFNHEPGNDVVDFILWLSNADDGNYSQFEGYIADISELCLTEYLPDMILGQPTDDLLF